MRWSQRRSGVYDVRYRTAAPISSEKKRPGGQCCRMASSNRWHGHRAYSASEASQIPGRVHAWAKEGGQGQDC